MFCEKCGKKLVLDSKICLDCGHESRPAIKKKGNLVWTIGKFFIFMFIFSSISSALSSFNDNKLNKNEAKEMGIVLQDAVTGTDNTSDEYDEFRIVMTDLIDYVREDSKDLTEVESIFEEEDILLPDSFKSKARMQYFIEGMNLYLTEFNSYFNERDKVAKDMIDIVNKSNLPSDQKASMLDGLKSNRSYMKGVERRLVKAGNESSDAIIALYRFLIINFDDYEIALDENYEETVFLNTDSQVEQYNALLTATWDSIDTFTLIYDEHIKAGQSKFDDLGLDVDFEGLQDDVFYNY